MCRLQRGSWLLVTVLLQACGTGTPLREQDGSRPAGFLDRGTGVEVRVAEDRSVAERTVAAAPAAAWRVLPAVYRELGLGGGVLGGPELAYGNPDVTGRTVAGARADTFFRCANEGAGPSRVNRFNVRFSIATTVSQGAEGRALLTTRVAAAGTPWEGTSTGAVICISRGLLEGAIERGVLARAASGV